MRAEVSLGYSCRHYCQRQKRCVCARQRSDEAIHTCLVALWIASRSLSSGAHSRDPVARNDGSCLVIITRHADATGDVVIARCELHASAGGLLADRGAIELLPGRLVGGIGEAA